MTTKDEGVTGGYRAFVNSMFRNLTVEEIQEFRKWARDNYVAGSPISEIWHPVVQEECKLINWEQLGE